MFEQKVLKVIWEELDRVTEEQSRLHALLDCQQIDELVELACSDLEAYERNDPASRGRAHQIIDHYPTYRAVLLHRIASFLLTAECASQLFPSEYLLSIAQTLSSRARMEAGVEIHPRAQIGHSFVIDHGWGSVIGETSEIGDNCYILGCVIFGAFGIANNREGKRHPTVGNRVQIGAHVRLLGSIKIGSDAFIGPYAIVTRDVPSGAKVTVVNQLQQARHGPSNQLRLLRLRGVIRMGDCLYVQSDELADPLAYLTSNHGVVLATLMVGRHPSDPGIAIVQFVQSVVEGLIQTYGEINLTIEDGGCQVDVKYINDLLLGAEYQRRVRTEQRHVIWRGDVKFGSVDASSNGL